MTTADHYAKVLEDLETEESQIKAQLDDLDEARNELIAKRDELRTLVEGIKRRVKKSGPYAGMGILEAAVAHLETVEDKEPVATRRLSEDLVSGGLESTADDFYSTLYGTLNRSDKGNGPVMKMGSGQWGLRSWVRSLGAPPPPPALDNVVTTD